MRHSSDLQVSEGTGNPWYHVTYNLNSSKGGYIRDYIGDYYRGYQGG